MKIYMIGANEINKRDVSLIRAAVEEVFSSFVTTRQLIPINFGISGYDHDPNALFDILEVRRWASTLYQEFPFIFSIVTPDTLRWLFPSVGDIQVMKRTETQTQVEFRPGAKEQLVNEMMNAQNVLFQRLASTQDEFDLLSTQGHERMMAAIVG